LDEKEEGRTKMIIALATPAAGGLREVSFGFLNLAGKGRSTLGEIPNAKLNAD
jgi:hypothetical protein